MSSFALGLCPVVGGVCVRFWTGSVSSCGRGLCPLLNWVCVQFWTGSLQCGRVVTEVWLFDFKLGEAEEGVRALKHVVVAVL